MRPDPHVYLQPIGNISRSSLLVGRTTDTYKKIKFLYSTLIGLVTESMTSDYSSFSCHSLRHN